jgi:uncharacterized membrane protein (DUF4010 family)
VKDDVGRLSDQTYFTSFVVFLVLALFYENLHIYSVGNFFILSSLSQTVLTSSSSAVPRRGPLSPGAVPLPAPPAASRAFCFGLLFLQFVASRGASRVVVTTITITTASLPSGLPPRGTMPSAFGLVDSPEVRMQMSSGQSGLGGAARASGRRGSWCAPDEVTGTGRVPRSGRP